MNSCHRFPVLAFRSQFNDGTNGRQMCVCVCARARYVRKVLERGKYSQHAVLPWDVHCAVVEAFCRSALLSCTVLYGEKFPH